MQRTRPPPTVDSTKLFELRTYGLPVDRKRKLEETLRDFVLGIDPPTTALSSTLPSSAMHISALPTKPTSSLTSTKFADSGYGGMTASNTVSNQASGSKTSTSTLQVRASRRNMTAPEVKARDRSIHSYLHDIPESLMPHSSAVMSDRAKMRAIVRRMEQLFAGIGATNDGHQQPIQQQEVAQSAAQADRFAMEAQGYRATAEGSREARNMAQETEEPMDLNTDSMPLQNPALEDGISQSLPCPDEHDLATAKAPLEQRPTRPLDLDLSRAQIPSDNIKYIRHLGFLAPLQEDKPLSSDDQGWIYLNLLTNMAQTHTLNVTTAFIQTAISEYSTQFELSSDGRKIRWHGSKEVGMFGRGRPVLSREGSNMRSPTGSDLAGRQRVPDMDFGLLSPSHGVDAFPQKQPLRRDSSMLTYSSMFQHHRQGSCSDDEERTSAPSPNIDNDVHRAPSVLTSIRHGSSGERKEDGVLVFYNDAPFCADLTGDWTRRARRNYRTYDYNLRTSHPLGKPMPMSKAASADERRNPLGFLFGLHQTAMENVTSKSHSPLDLTPSALPSKRVTFVEPDANAIFAVSGLGGIRPADNIRILVTCQQVQQSISMPLMPRRYRTTLARACIKPAKKSSVSTLLSTLSQPHCEDIAPSSLPPPTYAYLDDDEDDNESSTSSSGVSELSDPNLAALLAAAPSTMDSSSLRSNDVLGSSDDDSGVFDDDDGDASVDLLATARAHDPAAIRAKEREYDSELAERLAEDIPAGSSAATAGGGSGYASPDSRRDADEDDSDDDHDVDMEDGEQSIMS